MLCSLRAILERERVKAVKNSTKILIAILFAIGFGYVIQVVATQSSVRSHGGITVISVHH